MPLSIKLTKKRQATFPKAVCDQLGLKPGDRIELTPTTVNGKTAWLLETPETDPFASCFGILKHSAEGKSHDMEDIRASIGRGIAKEKKL